VEGVKWGGGDIPKPQVQFAAIRLLPFR
jgi:hypothetical protein